MVLLFLLALLFAWPTFGGSIIAYVAFVVLKGYLEARARIQRGSEARASKKLRQGQVTLPSWGADADECRLFVECIQRGAVQKGVPKVFLLAWLSHKGNVQELFYLAGNMEQEGATFVEQQVAVSDSLVFAWENAPANIRAAALA